VATEPVERSEVLVALPGDPGGARIVSLEQAERRGLLRASRLPRTLRILAESVLRRADPHAIADLDWLGNQPRRGIAEFHPGRLLLQDFTGLPLMTDLASMRDALAERGLDPRRVNPRIPVDFVVDHALIAEHGGHPDAIARNESHEVERNRERFEFLKWCAQAFDHVRILPPGSGIMHQLNLEHLATVVALVEAGDGGTQLAVADTLLGTDSHTTMVNGLGVLAWGVGGLEAEGAMLGRGTLLADPKVVALELTGALPAGVTANDLVLTIAERLRAVRVVDCFIEAAGEAVAHLPVETRAMIANMAPEYGATSLLFPIDQRTLDYLRLTGRDAAHIARVEAHAKAQGLWGVPRSADLAKHYDGVVAVDLSRIEPCMAGPSRPEQRVPLSKVPASFHSAFTPKLNGHSPFGRLPAGESPGERKNGDVVIAAITSCASTSSPAGMISAGLLARHAHARGLTSQPWVKTTFAPGSRVVADYLAAAGLQEPLDALGFNIVGYGCTTCNGNSGALAPEIEASLADGSLAGVAVLSGNRNFEGRIHPLVRAAYLASPALVVAHAIAGSVRLDLTRDPLGHDPEGKPVMLSDIWPSDADIAALTRHVTTEAYRRVYGAGLHGHAGWRQIEAPRGDRFAWRPGSTFLARTPIRPPQTSRSALADVIDELKPLALLGDGITTDHLSPNGQIRPGTPAARWLAGRQVAPGDLGTYAARRGHHAVAVRGTFANAHLVNEMVPEGGPRTRLSPTGNPIPIVDAAMLCTAQGIGTILIAGKRYGAGSSRDWAAKGVGYLGVRAVIAESFERIHRANLVAVGVLPLIFPAGVTRKTLGLSGFETFRLRGLERGLAVGGKLEADIVRQNGRTDTIILDVRIDTPREAEVLAAGGLLSVLLDELSQPG
jgi:aconitate hydratase